MSDSPALCNRCVSAPRWSRHWSCTLCAACAGRKMTWCLNRRKWTESEPRVPKCQANWCKRRKIIYRARYAALKEAGAGHAMARDGSKSTVAFRRAAAELGVPELQWREA